MSKRIHNLAIFIENKDIEEKIRELEKFYSLSYEDLDDDLKKEFDESVRYYFIRKTFEPYKKKLSKLDMVKLDHIHNQNNFKADGSIAYTDIVRPYRYSEKLVDFDESSEGNVVYIKKEDLYSDYSNHYYKNDENDFCTNYYGAVSLGRSPKKMFIEDKFKDIDGMWNYFSLDDDCLYLINKDGKRSNMEKLEDIDFDELISQNRERLALRNAFDPFSPNPKPLRPMSYYIYVHGIIHDGKWKEYRSQAVDDLIWYLLVEHKHDYTVITAPCHMISQEKLKEMIE